MKKFLLTLAVLLGFSGLANANTVTLDFVNNTYGMTRLSGSTEEYADNPTVIEQDGVKVTLSWTSSNGMRLWSNGLRIYSGTCSVKVEALGLTGITFDTAAEALSSVISASTGSYTYSGSTGTWKGSSDVVDFTVSLPSKNQALKVLTINFTGESAGEGGGETPEEPVTPEPPVEDESTTMTFDFVNNSYGLPIESGSSTNYAPNPSTFTSDGVVFTMSWDGTNGMRFWNDGLRVTKGAGNFTITLKAEAISKIVIKAKQAALITGLSATPGDLAKSSTTGTWTGSADEVTFTGSVSSTCAFQSIEVTYSGEGAEPDPTPAVPTGDKYELVTEITSGGEYLFVVNGNYGAPISSTASYGRLNMTPVTITDNSFNAPVGVALTIAEEEQGYTIKDAENRYFGMDSEHLTTFQLYTELNDGCYWTAKFDGNNVTFTNTLTNCIICQSGTYTNIAPAVVADGQTAPELYQLTQKGVPTGDVIFENPCTEETTDFTNVLAAGSFNPWSFDATWGLKASGNVDGTLTASDAYMVSPEFDLVNAISPVTLSFEDAVKDFGDVALGELGDYIQVVVREVGGEWTVLETPAHTAFNSFTVQTYDLNSYVGKKMQFGFHYVSTAEVAGTWGIKDVKLYAGEGSVLNSSVDNIAGFIANCTTYNYLTYSIENPVVALYQNGNNLYVKDDSGYLLVYGDTKQKYTNGMTIPAGITGKAQLYSGNTYELASPVASTFKAGTEGDAVAPENIDYTKLNDVAVNTYVQIRGGRFSQDLDGNWTLYCGKDAVPYYNKFGLTLVDGGACTIDGFIGFNKDQKVILPTVIDVYAPVATPTFSPKSGAVAEGSTVTIECADADAVIYYNFDGSNNYDLRYSEPIVITENVTIKAIAIKNGESSLTARTSFTVKAGGSSEPNDGDGSFDFSDPTTLSPSYSDEGLEADGTTGNFMHQVNDVTFTSGVASIVNVHPEGTGTNARLYKQSSGNWSYRFYKNSTTTISVPEGYVIESIEFTPQTSTHTTNLAGCTFSTGTFADNVWTASDDTTTEVVITVTGTVGLTYMKVNYKSTSGISDLEADEAPVEYYNLQGIRVANPEHGIYIRRQGNKVSKVAL